MSAMIDRIAKVIFDRGGPINWRDSVRLARHVISSMREPTPEMCQAAMVAAVTEENKGIEYAPSQGWKAMIDEAVR